MLDGVLNMPLLAVMLTLGKPSKKDSVLGSPDTLSLLSWKDAHYEKHVVS